MAGGTVRGGARLRRAAPLRRRHRLANLGLQLHQLLQLVGVLELLLVIAFRKSSRVRMHSQLQPLPLIVGSHLGFKSAVSSLEKLIEEMGLGSAS